MNNYDVYVLIYFKTYSSQSRPLVRFLQNGPQGSYKMVQNLLTCI